MEPDIKCGGEWNLVRHRDNTLLDVSGHVNRSMSIDGNRLFSKELVRCSQWTCSSATWPRRTLPTLKRLLQTFSHTRRRSESQPAIDQLHHEITTVPSYLMIDPMLWQTIVSAAMSRGYVSEHCLRIPPT